MALATSTGKGLHKVKRSPLTRRALLVNLLPPLLLACGLLYSTRYERTMIEGELDALQTQAELVAAALGEGAVMERPRVVFGIQPGVGFRPMIRRAGHDYVLDPDVARQVVRRIATHGTETIRLFDPAGTLLLDSRLLLGPGGLVEMTPLPPPEPSRVVQLWLDAGRMIAAALMDNRDLPAWPEAPVTMADDLPEAATALLESRPDRRVRWAAGQGMVLTAAVPVTFFRHTVGAVLLSKDGSTIGEALFQLRMTVVVLSGAALALTVLLSLYLARTVTRPVARLAQAAEQVRMGRGGPEIIPVMSSRQDELGELARGLHGMTQALWERLDATERFAADVSHELKNPLTSLRSAVETVARVKDPDQQKRLMGIIMEDVQRLDRLISDTADLSRLDTEMARPATEAVGLAGMLNALAALHQSTEVEKGGPALVLDVPPDDPLLVRGLEGRLVQVFRNLMGNAVSFSPPGGTITVSAMRSGTMVDVTVTDEGPGLPAGTEAKVFERFYTSRPDAEAFGTHSGLGLSISKRIIEGLGGSITAANRQDSQGAVFTVRLPAVLESR